MSIFLSYARYRYLIYRIYLRIRMGKEDRDQYMQKNGTSIIDFLPERPYKLGGGAKAIPRKGTSDFTVLFNSLEPELEPHLAMNEGEIFVDVGANVGISTLTVANNYADKGIAVIAIEAHPDNYMALCRNIKCNKSNIRDIVTTVNKAVADHKGIAAMFERTSGGTRVGTSLYSLFDTFVYNNNYVKKDGRVLQVECDTLDHILEGDKADVMSIDIEGAEVLALKGATKTLKSLRKIIVEIHGNNLEEVKQLLLKNGFTIEIVSKGLTYAIGSKCPCP